MITFFQKDTLVYAVETQHVISSEEEQKLVWLFSGMQRVAQESLHGIFIGPRREMITPWSTNAVEITQNMGMKGISRIEQLTAVQGASEAEATVAAQKQYDPMLQQIYSDPGQNIFFIDTEAEPIRYIDDLRTYTLSEVDFLKLLNVQENRL